MRISGGWLLAILALVQALPALAVDYAADVKPILKQHCYSCHGSLRQKSGLRLDHVTFLRQGGDMGPAIAATADESLLVRAVSGTADFEQMPLDAKPLTSEQIATLRAWIEAGAIAPEETIPDDPRQHWSFQKPVRPPLPEVRNPQWAVHPLDRFIAEKHEQSGFEPVAPAAKNVLLRRVYLDLIGLPPTPIELRAYLADDASDAYERVVDRLLASPRYGERWGRHWMDVWRYSDWDGFGAEVRESQPHIWRWRDWIIEALNADRPYDRMIEEMLAADEIAPGDPAALRASGFLVRSWYKFNRNVWMEGIVEHTSKAFLGVTLNCARCHDHMYDPILQTEYYQFRAFFEPHNIRTDRVPGQSDTRQSGLVRVFDEKFDAPTHLFKRGNEATPDKEHPLAPAVPRVLGGDELAVAPVTLAPPEYYGGLQGFVQQEALAATTAALDRDEAAMNKANATLAAARKQLADFVAAKAASDAAAKETPAVGAGNDAAPAASPEKSNASADKPAAEPSEGGLAAAVGDAEADAALAEQAMLTAAAGLVAVRAKIAADNAAFATPPAADATQLAREASRAERVFNMHDTRQSVARLERSLAKDRAAGGDDAEKIKKQVAETEKKLAEARKARDTAQAALGQAADSYTRFTPVYPATSTGRRAALARWIASKNNPLTARVAINHIWMRHFGSPLVPTVFDFGLNGKRPTHPELLDWLAVELMDQGWRMKPIHRLIVTSAAYRLASAPADSSNTGATNQQRDPENLLLWRANSRRMEAEVVRDSTLAVAGSLDTTMFGPDLDENTGLTVPRRSIYFRSSKEKKVTFLDMFDRANVTDCYRRSETVVPQQALAMINSSLTLTQARLLAASLANEAGATPTSESPPEAAAAVFVTAAFHRILSRSPTADEQRICLEFLADQSRRFADPAALVAFAAGADNPVKPSSDPQQRARENLVHVLLNHSDFLTVR